MPRGMEVQPIRWTAASNDGTTTASIDFEFAYPVSRLTTENIAVTAGTSTVTTGVLTGDGTSWSLAATVTSLGDGDISVSINRPGIEGGPSTVDVFRPPVSWTAAAYGHPFTTAINFDLGITLTKVPM